MTDFSYSQSQVKAVSGVPSASQQCNKFSREGGEVPLHQRALYACAQLQPLIALLTDFETRLEWVVRESKWVALCLPSPLYYQ